MTKTILMVLGLAAFTGASLACFGLLSGGRERPAAEESCEGLTGQAKIDCEKREASERP